VWSRLWSRAQPEPEPEPEEPEVFQRIEIRLTGPICRCQGQDLAWGIRRDSEGRSTLQIECRNCQTTLTVSHSQFIARFVLDNPYPADRPAPAPAEPSPEPEPDPEPDDTDPRLELLMDQEDPSAT